MIETMPSALFDGVVLPDHPSSIAAMVGNGLVLEFVKDQFRHCKPILAIGEARRVLEAAGIPPTLPSGAPDAGVVRSDATNERAVRAFCDALARHRHFARETDPPSV
jgi:catalase